ncbi:hypothetical protein AVEN_191747-1 [Araneus ventricosus]|uniref:Uncharacterized protein n=1 Tax=Araneus ventricosus TaxID=182803 RepID=A0A4Y2KGU2_ARAVE|nr:hypothetical protein AVEN_191747-1 [Araneus ventricosus]
MPQQFEFTPQFSTTHQLLRVVEHINEGKDSNLATAAIFLDIAKAFDKVGIEGLIHKLIAYKFPQYIIELLEIISKLFFRYRSKHRCWICAISQKRRPFRSPLRRGKKKKYAGAISGEYGGCSRTITLLVARKCFTRIAVCDGRCFGAVSTVHSGTSVAKPAECVAAAVSKLPHRIPR